MAVEFRCEHCGELVSADGPAGQEVTCPYCESVTIIPEGIASLPSPQIPGMDSDTDVDVPADDSAVDVDDVDATDEAGEGDADELDEEDLEEGETSEFMIFLAKCTPWLISTFVHAAVLLLLFVLVLAVIYKGDPEQAEVNSTLTEPPGAVVSPVQMQDVSPNVTPEPVRYSPTESTAITDTASTDTTVQAIGRSGGNSSSGHPLGTGTGAGMGGGIFQGGGGTVQNVVYVIDRSGSMHATFEDVRQELLSEIGLLQPEQTYHVIIFATGDPLEKDPPRLTLRGPQDDPGVMATGAFLAGIEPFGQTNPIPALRRAFLVVRAAGNEGGSQIELLTDGSFPDNREVLRLIRERNVGGRVFVNTYLYGHRSREAEAVLQTIANENGGRYKYISPDEFQR